MNNDKENYFTAQDNSFTCESCETETANEHSFYFEDLTLCKECAFDKVQDHLLASERYNPEFLTDAEFNQDILFFIDKVSFVDTKTCDHPTRNHIKFKNTNERFCPICGYIFPF